MNDPCSSVAVATGSFFAAVAGVAQLRAIHFAKIAAQPDQYVPGTVEYFFETEKHWHEVYEKMRCALLADTYSRGVVLLLVAISIWGFATVQEYQCWAMYWAAWAWAIIPFLVAWPVLTDLEKMHYEEIDSITYNKYTRTSSAGAPPQLSWVAKAASITRIQLFRRKGRTEFSPETDNSTEKGPSGPADT